jgi:hypothetical protein
VKISFRGVWVLGSEVEGVLRFRCMDIGQGGRGGIEVEVYGFKLT